MNILILSKADYANSGHKLAEAINQNPAGHKAICIPIEKSKFSFKRKTLAEYNPREMMTILDDADVLIFKGDDVFREKFGNYRIPNKPAMILFGGSWFLKNHKTLLVNLPKNVKMLGALRPDLLFNKNMVYVPHPIDLSKWRPVIRNNNPLVIGHSISNMGQSVLKGSTIIEKLVKQTPSTYSFIFSKPFEEAKKLKERCDIYVESIGFRYYGNNGIEACALGIPTLAEITIAKSMREDLLKDCGVINVSASTLKQELTHLIEDKIYRDACGLNALNWCKTMHSYEAVSDRLIRYCKKIL